MGPVMGSGMLMQPQAWDMRQAQAGTLREPHSPAGLFEMERERQRETDLPIKYLRKPEFDVSLSVQKSNPFTKEQQNQTILQLWGAGFFNPQMIELSTIALELMQFEGRDELVEQLRQFGQMQAQLQQLQAQNQHLQQQVQQAQATKQPQMTQGGSGQLVEIPFGATSKSPISVTEPMR